MIKLLPPAQRLRFFCLHLTRRYHSIHQAVALVLHHHCPEQLLVPVSFVATEGLGLGLVLCIGPPPALQALLDLIETHPSVRSVTPALLPCLLSVDRLLFMLV